MHPADSMVQGGGKLVVVVVVVVVVIKVDEEAVVGEVVVVDVVEEEEVEIRVGNVMIGFEVEVWGKEDDVDADVVVDCPEDVVDVVEGAPVVVCPRGRQS